jgi:LmbE family N-acetylglucosaminyl deacetylase
MNILIVAAHPDDELLGCGGTIARLSREGHNVSVTILGEGITSRFSNRNQADPKLVRALQDCSRKVGQMLGVKDLTFYQLPDNRFDTVPLLDIIKPIENLIANLKPQVVYTHLAGDLNIDHAIVNRAVLTATRPPAAPTVKTIYAFEVASSSEWTFQSLNPVFRPNTFVDISTTLETKIEAMKIYETETRSFPHPRSTKALISSAQRWGSVAGIKAAEPFELIREVR